MPNDARVPPPPPTVPSTPEAIRRASGELAIADRIGCPSCHRGRRPPPGGCLLCGGAGHVSRETFRAWADAKP